MRRSLTLIILLLLLAACQATAQPTATLEPTLQGTVNITTPMSGALIYAEALWIAGEADNVPQAGFKLRVVTAEDVVLAETTVQPQDGQWLVELVHGYTGDPSEVSIYALALDERIVQDYDIETILIAPLAMRPEGVFGSIHAPQDGATPGGDTILVTGSASGVFENQFTLTLEQPDGTEIASVPVTMTNPYFVDEMLWEASLPTHDYTGPAVIRAYALSPADGSIIPLGQVTVMVSRIAG
jgi:Immunoglobulin-like domain of bacterial spore germination